MGRVHCVKATTDWFEALSEKDEDTLYFVNDTGTFSPLSMETSGKIYLGDKLISSHAAQLLILQGGQKVMYNGVDVSNSSQLGYIVAAADGNWYGTQSAYNKKVQAGTVQNGIAYHIKPQADWNNTDPDSLSYIQNKPDVMDLRVQDTAAVFFYK